MVRLTDEQADRIALGLLYIKANYPTTTFSIIWRDMWRQYREDVNHEYPPPYMEDVQPMLEARHEDRNISGILEMDIEALMQSASSAHTPADITLIEKLVDIIKTPFTRNIITVDMLNRIREALLLPDERAGLAETLASYEYKCGACKRTLHNGEMTTLVQNLGGNPMIACATCHPPVRVACGCPGCNEGVALDKRTLGVLNKPHVCMAHSENPAAEVPETPPSFRSSVFSNMEQPVAPPNVSAPNPMGNAERQRQLRDVERELARTIPNTRTHNQLQQMRSILLAGGTIA